MRREQGLRVNGPYKHGKRWRVVVTRGDGHQVAESFATRAEAQRVVDATRAQIEGRTVTWAVEAFLGNMRERGLKATTIRTAEYRLTALLQLGAEGSRPLGQMTTTRADAFYRARAEVAKADTHRNELATARAFGAYCVRRGWLKANPFAATEAVGRRSAGKEQPRVDDAKRYLAAALEERTPEGLAATMPLVLGMRASEVTDRVVRDVDDGGRLLWIDRAKTRAGDRHLIVPDLIRGALLELTAGRAGLEPLFGAGNDRQWLYYHVGRIADLVGALHVTPHSLRGLHATLAVSVGTPVEHVARALGHADTEVTRRHYLAAGAERRGRAGAALTVLAGGLAGNAATAERYQVEEQPDPDPKT